MKILGWCKDGRSQVMIEVIANMNAYQGKALAWDIDTVLRRNDS
jgi:hypothetical protein